MAAVEKWAARLKNCCILREMVLNDDKNFSEIYLKAFPAARLFKALPSQLPPMPNY